MILVRLAGYSPSQAKLSSGKDVAHCDLMPFGHVDRGKGSGASTNVAVAFVVKASQWYLHDKDH